MSGENWRLILERVAIAAQRSGRNPQSVRVLAVSKLQPVEKVRELHAAGGFVDFGENYVQECLGKMSELADLPLRWHLIGHLQKNKIKQISGRCHLIHSVDSLALADALGKKAVERNGTEKVLLQINVAGEESKEGFSEELLLSEWPRLRGIPGLEIRGLMTMPPLQNQPEENRIHFRRLRLLRDRLSTMAGAHPLEELSMGTSHDFEIAIEEGATIVRLGTVLFGERR